MTPSTNLEATATLGRVLVSRARRAACSQAGLDGWGASASALCAAHCALAPLLVSAPWIGLELVMHPACELGLLLMASALAVATLFRGVLRRQRRGWPLALAACGLALIWTAHLGLEGALEHVATVLGAAVLVGAHVANARVCGRCP